MTATTSTSTTPALQNSYTARSLLVLVVLAVAAASGCAADTGVFAEQVEADGSEQALIRGGSGPRLGFTCSNGTCTCDKSIENDCEDMSGVCTEASIDGLIACIKGWLTTHCTCTQIRRAPLGGGGSVFQPPTGDVLTTVNLAK